MTDLVTVTGPGAQVVGRLLSRRWLAPSIQDAAAAAAVTNDPIVTPDGIVLRGADRMEGGGACGARGLLTARREIKGLRERLQTREAALDRLVAELTAWEADAGRWSDAATAAGADQHALEKELVGCQMRVERLDDDQAQLAARQRAIETERRHMVEERSGLEDREAEARESIHRLEVEQQLADERFMGAQASLLEARDTVDVLAGRVADAKAEHARMAERVEALAADARRLGDQLQDLHQRIEARRAGNLQARADRQRLLEEVARTEEERDAEVRALDGLRREIAGLDARVGDTGARIAACDDAVKRARADLDAARAAVAQEDVARATVDADLTHLAEACRDALQTALPRVLAEVVEMEADGPIEPDRAFLAAGDPGDGFDADQMVDALRDRIDRLGPVNMMAIDQFDELEERHAFLTGQRQDLLDSIAATGEAIARIDATTRERFREAFTAVNEYFQGTFQTLFGGGRAGLVLLDETDLLESGIDIIAQPPGKRLQSIQLLSGGEKALTAMALMFAIFKYRPSPFCLLDEIDAPLDDANIGRFVEMLRGLLERTQFVLVTHNRKTMEIADRLYGITMEEPGVSKLISVKMS